MPLLPRGRASTAGRAKEADETSRSPHRSALETAAAQLVSIVEQLEEIELDARPRIRNHVLIADLKIDTRGFEIVDGGLAVEAVERVRLTAGAGYPLIPPTATVEHVRWIGFPHVLRGRTLCLFLDPSREWDPTAGMAGALHRLWGWLEDAIAGRFNAADSLHHALGGVPHHRIDDDTLVIKECPDPLDPGIHTIAIAQRTPRRYDIVGWDRPPAAGETRGLAVVTNGPLHLGLGATLHQLVQLIDQPASPWRERHLPHRGFPPADAILAQLAHSARSVGPDEPLRMLVAARNPAVSGPGAYDLAVVTLDPATRQAAGLPPAPSGSGDPSEATLEFMRPDDTRPELLIRRDYDRPVSWFIGKRVHLFGCGALGSWFAELVARAGAAHVTLTDPATIARGLLVRQNYVEDDVGTNKAEGLTKRLRSVNDDTTVEPLNDLSMITDPGSPCDLIVDASVSQHVNTFLEHLRATSDDCPPMAQVATDSVTSTLGIVTLVPKGGQVSLVAAQRALNEHVDADASLEDFKRLWDPDDDGLFAPARGCSVPTFHGSAADAMGIASTAISLLGPAVAAGLAGGFLFALPHTAATVPARTWIPAAGGSQSLGVGLQVPTGR